MAWYPSTLPSWTHEDTSVHARERDRSPEERRPRRLTAAVMRLHSRQVCLITCRQTWLFQRPSSHTPTPIGSLVKGGVKGRGDDDDDDKGGASHSSQNIYILGIGRFPRCIRKKKLTTQCICLKSVHQIQVGILSSSLRVNMTNHNKHY